MNPNLIARASIEVEASKEATWKALVDPVAIKQYMFGTQVTSDFRVGGPITWEGEWQGRAYKDKGAILRCEPGRALQYTHFSPLSGLPDRVENYHTVTIELTGDENRTRVDLAQDNNPTEEARAHSQKNWESMLGALKQFLER